MATTGTSFPDFHSCLFPLLLLSVRCAQVLDLKHNYFSEEMCNNLKVQWRGLGGRAGCEGVSGEGMGGWGEGLETVTSLA